ncbi:MAG: hypothetical protein KDB23_06555, partial [Planctomycetales bacterium]|nr:hypothetical protein [Planctomycetales bacterium]
MLRNLLSLAVVLALSTVANASLHTFDPGSYGGSGGTFSIVGGPTGVIDVTSLLIAGPPIDHFSISPSTTFSANVTGTPLTFDATKLLVTSSQVSIEMRSAADPTYLLDVVMPGSFTPNGTVPSSVAPPTTTWVLSQ